MADGEFRTCSEIYNRVKELGFRYVKSTNQIGQFLRAAHRAGAGVEKRPCQIKFNGGPSGTANISEWAMTDADAYMAWLRKRAGKDRRFPMPA